MKLFSDNEVLIGIVASPHGNAGTVKVLPLTDFPERIHELEKVELAQGDQRKLARVESAAISGRYWLLKLAETNSREEALQLKGCFLVVSKKTRISLPEGTYYHDQLLGLKVLTRDGECLGQIVDVIAGGGHDQYVMRFEQTGNKVMIPAVKEIILSIDLEAGKIIIDPPEGLLEL